MWLAVYCQEVCYMTISSLITISQFRWYMHQCHLLQSLQLPHLVQSKLIHRRQSVLPSLTSNTLNYVSTIRPIHLTNASLCLHLKEVKIPSILFCFQSALPLWTIRKWIHVDLRLGVIADCVSHWGCTFFLLEAGSHVQYCGVYGWQLAWPEPDVMLKQV